jgi:hypothetical protein
MERPLMTSAASGRERAYGLGLTGLIRRPACMKDSVRSGVIRVDASIAPVARKTDAYAQAKKEGRGRGNRRDLPW